MSKFGPDQTQVNDVQSFSTVKKPAEQSNAFAKGFRVMAGFVADEMRDRAEKNKQTVTSSYAQAQLKILNAIDQGKIDPSYGRTLLRNTTVEYFNNYPGMTKELQQTASFVMGAGGIGSVATKETRQEQGLERLFNEGVDNGFLSPGASDEEILEYGRVAAEGKRAAEQLQEERDRINLELAKTNLSEAQRKAANERLTDATEKYLIQTGPGERQRFQTTLNNIFNDTSLDAAGKAAAIEQAWIDLESNFAEEFQQVSSNTKDAWLSSFERMRDLAEQRATGQLSADAYDQQTKAIENLHKYKLLQKPEIAALYTESKMFKELGPLINNMFLQGRLDRVARILGGEANPYNGGGGATIDFLTQDTEGDEVMEKDKQKHFSDFLNMLADSEATLARDPKKGVEIMNAMASPKFLQLVQEQGGVVGDSLDGAKDVISRHFDDEVWNMVRDEFNSRNIFIGDPTQQGGISVNPAMGGQGGGEDVAVTSLVGYQATDAGIKFYALDPNNAEAKLEAQSLNKKLAPVINTNVRATAHLNGRSDYGQVFRELETQYLAPGAPEGVGGGDAGDDLDLSDFQRGLEDLGQGAGPVGDVVDAGPGYTVVTTPDGTVERRTGTRAWRNNNPGNIEYGSFAKKNGAVGSDGRFAVFPSYEAGRAAKAELLWNTSSYKGKTVMQAISRYAPSFENNTSAYARTVAEAAGVSINTPMSSLTEEQRELFLDAMERVEGFKAGTIQEVS